MLPWIAIALSFLGLLLLYRRHGLGFAACAASESCWSWLGASIGDKEIFLTHLIFVVACVFFWLTAEREGG